MTNNTSKNSKTSTRSGSLHATCAALLLAFCLLLTAAPASALVLQFDTSNYSGDVWLQVQDPTQNFSATYGSGGTLNFVGEPSGVIMTEAKKLTDIGSAGLNITYSPGAVFFLYYDDPTTNDRTQAPAYPDSAQRFQPFELTVEGSSGDQGNLTCINYFTAPLGITSYQNDPSQNSNEPVLQQTGFGNNTAEDIGELLDTATSGKSNAYVAKANGTIARYLGPSNFATGNPYKSFLDYMQSVNTANQSTTIQRYNGFNFAPPNDTPVYQFGGDLNMTVDATGKITASGSIKHYTSDDPTNIGEWTDANIIIAPSDIDAYNFAIYGQTASSAVTFEGTGWASFQSYCDSTTNPGNASQSLSDLGAYTTTRNMLIGEITTGILGGFVNSDHSVGDTHIKDMVSNEWWSLDPLVAFDTIQPHHTYYNVYAQVIFDTSNNGAYGIPYSDRFGSGPLVDSNTHDGTPVGYWVISVGAPLGAATTPVLTGQHLLLLGQ